MTDSRVSGIVTMLLRKYPAWATSHSADNQCRIASQLLVAALQAEGISAREVWVRGHQRELPDATPRALASPRHMVARMPDGRFIDVTRRQYEPDRDHPLIYRSEHDLGADWLYIDDGPFDGAAADEVWRALR